MTIPAASVTVTLTPSDTDGAGTAVTFTVFFAAATYTPPALMQPTGVMVALNDDETGYTVSWTEPTDKTGIGGYYVSHNPIEFVEVGTSELNIGSTKPTAVSVWSTRDTEDMSPTEAPTDVTPGMANLTGLADIAEVPMLAAGAYLVVVPKDHDASALPQGIDTHTVADMPDLVDLFTTGGTIDVVVTGKANHNVIITEIMLAKDLSRRGQTGAGRPEAGQWIELYNNTNDPIDISAIALKFREESPAIDAPANTTDRISNTVSGSGWAITAFESALSGETGLNASRIRVVTANFNSIRRVHKDNKQLQNTGTEIQNGWLSSSWALTANTREYRAGRIGTPGAENRPTVYAPPVYVAPDMSVTFNEIANLNDNTNEWIELKGPADTNMRKYKISIVTAYNKDTNTGTENTIFQFPDNDNIKIPSTGILLLTDQSPRQNKLEADIEDGVEKPVRYRIVELEALPNGHANFLLVLRNKDGKILDVAGHVAEKKLSDNDPYTLMWPLADNAGAAKEGAH